MGGGPTRVLSEAAHGSGLEFHRWIWILNRSGDTWVRENHPEWFTVSRNGVSSLEAPPYVDYYQWLCPTRPEVRTYIRDSVVEIARDPAVDGIHLDYVRHCDVILPRGLWPRYGLVQDREYPEFDFCYCEACRGAFSSETGIDPLDLPDPTADPAWRRFRWDSVTGLVEVLAAAVHELGNGTVPGAGRGDKDTGHGGGPWGDRPSILRPDAPGKPVSAAVFPTPTIARRLVRQAWDEWPLDAFFPMLYHEFYEEGLEWIGASVREGLETLGGRPPLLIAGLYLPTLDREGNRDAAVEVARTAGAHGVSFFEMAGLEPEAQPDPPPSRAR